MLKQSINGELTRKDILDELGPLGFKKGSFSYFCGLAGVKAVERRAVDYRLRAIYPPDAADKIKAVWQNKAGR